MPPEYIILVDISGKAVGQAEKLAAHNADTPLHLAFSCYIFNDAGELLVTQRAHVKKVWPTVWTNSVCGHPGPGEPMEAAIVRRLEYELGMTANDITCAIPEYIYKTPPYRGIIEHEYCPIYIARAASPPLPNRLEVDAYRWMAWQDYAAALEADAGNAYSWWCKDQLRLLKDSPLIRQYTVN